jgi:nicotinamidase-related amidase
MPRRKRAGRDRALLIIDMITPLDFPEGPALLRQALPVARAIARMRRRVQGRWPVIYVNDNFMHWQADFREIFAACAAAGSRGRELARALPPAEGDYFVLKPKHSGFFQTPLEVLLGKLGVRQLVLTGVAADGCVLATAADAHLRELALHVPSDCVAAVTRARTRRALAVMRDAFHAETGASRGLR